MSIIYLKLLAKLFLKNLLCIKVKINKITKKLKITLISKKGKFKIRETSLKTKEAHSYKNLSAKNIKGTL